MFGAFIFGKPSLPDRRSRDNLLSGGGIASLPDVIGVADFFEEVQGVAISSGNRLRSILKSAAILQTRETSSMVMGWV